MAASTPSTRFVARVPEADVRAAWLRIERGEASLSAEARRLGYYDHRALANRIKKLRARAQADLDASADRQAHDKQYRDGLRRARAKGHIPQIEQPEVGRTFPERYDEVRAALSDDAAERLRAQARAEAEQAAAERADRRARFGFAPNAGRTYRDPEAAWVQGREDEAAAALAFAAEHPEATQRHAFFTLDERQVGRSPAGLTAADLEAKAERLAERHGPVEYRALP